MGFVTKHKNNVKNDTRMMCVKDTEKTSQVLNINVFFSIMSHNAAVAITESNI